VHEAFDARQRPRRGTAAVAARALVIHVQFIAVEADDALEIAERTNVYSPARQVATAEFDGR
jgi:hypothetical protein